MNRKTTTETEQNIDYLLVIAVAALLTIGLMMIYSATFALGYQLHNNPTYYFTRQLLWAGIGGMALLFFVRIEYHTWRRFSIPIMGLTVLLMLVVLLVGDERFGGQRWLFNGSVQPSELSKLAIIIYLADWLSSKGKQIRNLSDGLVPFAILLGLVTSLIVLQQDLSTAILVGMTAMAMFFIAGGSLKHIFVSGVVGSVILAFLITSASYRLQRFIAFWDPLNSDPLGNGYHIRQILIALGSGGATGLGLGASRQKFGYIPASHTDGIFAILGEELGLFGCLVVVGLFAFLAYRAFQISLQAPDSFGTILAAGVTCSLIFQAIVNVGVVTATLPFTGVPLPFISFGGSSLVISMASVGLLLAVSRGTLPPELTKSNSNKRRRNSSATNNFWRRYGGARLSSFSHHPGSH